MTHDTGQRAAGNDGRRIMLAKGDWLRCERGHGIAAAVRDIRSGDQFVVADFDQWMISKPSPGDDAECPCGAEYGPHVLNSRRRPQTGRELLALASFVSRAEAVSKQEPDWVRVGREGQRLYGEAMRALVTNPSAPKCWLAGCGGVVESKCLGGTMMGRQQYDGHVHDPNWYEFSDTCTNGHHRKDNRQVPCARCGQIGYDGPKKPATTEPPEWTNSPIAPDVWNRLLDHVGAMATTRATPLTVGHQIFVNGEPHEVTFVTTGEGDPPEPSPLSRALEQFIERRKAKRKAAWIEWCDLEDGRTWNARMAELDRAQILDAAMQAPVSFTARLGGRT